LSLYALFEKKKFVLWIFYALLEREEEDITGVPLVVMMLYLGWNGVGLPIAFLPGST
jgi:hypothetical protein